MAAAFARTTSTPQPQEEEFDADAVFAKLNALKGRSDEETDEDADETLAEAVDELLEEAFVTVDLAKRKELLGRAQGLIWNEAPYAWMYVDDVVSAARRELLVAEVWPFSFTITRNAHY